MIGLSSVLATVSTVIAGSILLNFRSLFKGRDKKFKCPKCGKDVGESEGSCPKCGAQFEEGGFECPKCEAQVSERDRACPNCGERFDLVEDYACPECGTTVRFNAKSCPDCGAKFWSPVKASDGKDETTGFIQGRLRDKSDLE